VTGNPAPAALAYIGLGSNLDGPLDQVRRALDALDRLPDSRCVARSRCYWSAPLGPPDQPWYVNAVAQIATRLAPEALLAALQEIEARHGRVRAGAVRWGPRPLDLDLLLYADRVSVGATLCLPHPGLARRAFVLYPLLEIAGPGLRIPGLGELGALCQAIPRDGLRLVEEVTASPGAGETELGTARSAPATGLMEPFYSSAEARA
jgi:2-amino-4-hydroxy-6-hydroxymethyldihydropteridine diphosphokinase